MTKKWRAYLFAMAVFFFLILPFAKAKEQTDNIHYEIWVELDHQNRMLHGKETITWFNYTRDEVKDIWIHLYWNAFKNEKSALLQEAKTSKISILDLDGKIKEGEWGWIDLKSVLLEDGSDLLGAAEFAAGDQPIRSEDQTVMRIPLPKPLKPGQNITLNIGFESKIPRALLRSGYYHDGYFFGQWFPKPGVYEQGKGWNCHQYHLNSEFFSDFAEFTVHITVPKAFVVGASGKEMARKENEERGTVTYTYWQNRIHDFAWTADPDYIKIERDFIASKEVTPEEYQQVASTLRLPMERIKLGNVKMILLINPEHKNQVERHFKALKAAIKYYGLWYGPYPYETITMVDPPFRSESGGMEYPTLFTAGTHILQSRKVHNPESVIIHEFGHNYWYGMCANNEFEEAWLDEGINTYSTGKALRHAYGGSILPVRINGIPLTRYSDKTTYFDYQIDRLAGILIAKTDPIITNAWQFNNIISYGFNVYFRASACLYTLENILGEDVMLRVLRTYQRDFRFKHPHSDDFIKVVNRVSGRDMTWFFDEFFFKANAFDYGIGLVSSEKVQSARGMFDKDDAMVEIDTRSAKKLDKAAEHPQYLSIVKVRRLGEAKLGGDVRLEIKIVFEDGSTLMENWDGQSRWAEFQFVRRSKIKFVQIDPDNKFLMDANITNNSYKRNPGVAGVLRWTSTLFFWIQNIMQYATAVS